MLWLLMYVAKRRTLMVWEYLAARAMCSSTVATMCQAKIRGMWRMTSATWINNEIE